MLVLTKELLLSAYAVGLFPMANDRNDPIVHWIEPRLRGILPLDEFHASRSLRKTLRKQTFTLTVNREFNTVINACADPTPVRNRTWLNDELIDAYCGLHDAGHAHSIETWHDGELVGGLYGVALGGAFFGESMFSRQTDASKVALCALVCILRRAQFLLLDTQFLTDHLSSFGAREITRENYRNRLRRIVDMDVSLKNGLKDPLISPEDISLLA